MARPEAGERNGPLSLGLRDTPMPKHHHDSDNVKLTAVELLVVVRKLPARAKVTERLVGRTDLKPAWVGWLSEYGTSGFYDRVSPGLYARSAYTQLKSAPMLGWLAEQLGENPLKVRTALTRAVRIDNVGAAAARFRRAIPWASIEPRVRACLGATVRTRHDLRRKIERLSAASPETDRFTDAWKRRGTGQQESPGPWYDHQKDHWLGWLAGYSGPGAYGRATWRRSAEFVFNHVVNPQMLIWLAEALGVEQRSIRRAVRDALTKRSMAAMSAAVRRVIPWSTIEPLLTRRR